MKNNISLNYELNKSCFFAGDQTQMMYLLIEAKPTNGQVKNQVPVNLCLVMDRSASMKGAKIENVKKAIINIIDRLTPHDFLSIVIFNENAEVIVPSQAVIDKDQLKEFVNQLRPEGGTAISSGMIEGLNETMKNLSNDKINRMMILTDGQTYGDEESCYQLAAEAASKGISITALGVGDEWYEEVIDRIAIDNGGKSDYIETADDIFRIFESELQNIKNIVTKNNQLKLRFTAGLQPRKVCRVLPYISELDYDSFSDSEITINIGDLDRNEGQSILAEILLSPKQKGRFRISQAELTYDIPGENITQEKVRADIVAEFSKDEAACKNINPKVMNIVEKVSAYNIQTKALAQAATNDISGATIKLRAAATRLLDMGEIDLAEVAMKEADNLEKRGAMSSSGTKKLRYETRKLTRRLVDAV